jgi:hypothetical protein
MYFQGLNSDQHSCPQGKFLMLHPEQDKANKLGVHGRWPEEEMYTVNSNLNQERQHAWYGVAPAKLAISMVDPVTHG